MVAIHGGRIAWTKIDADEELGYIYLPLTSPTATCTARAHRLGNNLFSDSVVCIKAETGERVWHFKRCVTDLWDQICLQRPFSATLRSTASG